MTLSLSEADMRALAAHFVDLLRGEGIGDYRAPRWAKTKELCKELNISDDYAFQHKRQLGAVILPGNSSGERARDSLRWDMDVARAWYASLRIGGPAAVAPKPPKSCTQTVYSARPAPRTLLTPRPYVVP